MPKVDSVQEYIDLHPKWCNELELIAAILNNLDLQVSIKWNAPVYTVNGKNVLGLGAFKNHFGIWFFNGVFLSDPNKLLINAQEDKTKALRQMRFEKGDVLNIELVKNYVLEAIDNELKGKKISPQRTKKKDVSIPEPLNNILITNTNLKSSFYDLSASKQREYCEYIDSAKRESTKLSRIEKILPMILDGKGLNDKYRK